MWTDMTRHGIRETIRELGKIQVGDDPSYVLADLLAEGTVPAGDTFWSAITEAEYDAAIDAENTARGGAISVTYGGFYAPVSGVYAPLPGPYANDAAAAAASPSVQVGQTYMVTGGTIAWRQTLWLATAPNGVSANPPKITEHTPLPAGFFAMELATWQLSRKLPVALCCQITPLLWMG